MPSYCCGRRRGQLGVDGFSSTVARSNQLYGYLYPWLDPDTLCTQLGRRARLTPLRGSGACGTPFDGYVAGHTHPQFMRVYEGKPVLNPGSVGFPRDGVWRTSYAVLDTEEGSIMFERVKYDVTRVARKLGDLGVSGPYLEALKYMLYHGRVLPRNMSPKKPSSL